MASVNGYVVANVSAQSTVYTLTPINSSINSILSTIGITGPIIFQQAGQQKKFNITQKAKNAKMQRMLDANFIVFQTPVENMVGLEYTFSPASPTIQTLSNIANLNEQVGPIVFSLKAYNPIALTTANYPICILLDQFSGWDENERQEDVTFTFAASPALPINVGALANDVASITNLV